MVAACGAAQDASSVVEGECSFYNMLCGVVWKHPAVSILKHPLELPHESVVVAAAHGLGRRCLVEYRCSE